MPRRKSVEKCEVFAGFESRVKPQKVEISYFLYSCCGRGLMVFSMSRHLSIQTFPMYDLLHPIQVIWYTTLLFEFKGTFISLLDVKNENFFVL